MNRVEASLVLSVFKCQKSFAVVKWKTQHIPSALNEQIVMKHE